MLDLGHHSFGFDIAGNHQYRIRSAIVLFEPGMHIVQHRRIEVVHRADCGPGVGMIRRVNTTVLNFCSLAIGSILALAFFVLNHAPLLVEFFLGDGAQQVAHTVRL